MGIEDISKTFYANKEIVLRRDVRKINVENSLLVESMTQGQ